MLFFSPTKYIRYHPSDIIYVFYYLRYSLLKVLACWTDSKRQSVVIIPSISCAKCCQQFSTLWQSYLMKSLSWHQVLWSTWPLTICPKLWSVTGRWKFSLQTGSFNLVLSTMILISLKLQPLLHTNQHQSVGWLTQKIIRFLSMSSCCFLTWGIGTLPGTVRAKCFAFSLREIWYSPHNVLIYQAT